MFKRIKINHKLNHVLITTLLLLAVAATVISACGRQSESDKSSLETIVVGIDKFEPYSYQDMNGNYVGIDVELARQALESLGYEPEFKFIDWEDKDDYLADGTIDCIWSCYSITGREDKYEWAGPYMYSRQVVAVRADSDIEDLSDLENRRVGVQATTKAENIFLHIEDSSVPADLQVYSFSTTDELFAVLRKGYVDAIAGHEALISQLTEKNNSYRMLDESPYMSQIGVAFYKGTHQDLAESLTRTLVQMKKDGTMGGIVEKYGLDQDKLLWGGEDDEE